MNKIVNNAPSYWANIPPEVRYSRELSAQAKLIFAELNALSNTYGYAFPSNEFIAGLYGISERTVSRIINELHDKKFVKIVSQITTKGTLRKIYINEKLPKNPLDSFVHPPLDNVVHTPQTKMSTALYINNTSNNNTSISKESINDTNKVISTNKKYKKISLSVIKELCNSLSLKKIKPEVFYNYYSVRNFKTKDGVKITLDNLDNFLSMWDARELEPSNNKNNNSNQNHQVGANENLSWMDEYYEAFGEEE